MTIVDAVLRSTGFQRHRGPGDLTVELPQRPPWQVAYVRTAVVVDLLVGLTAGLVALLVRFGDDAIAPYVVAVAATPFLWVATLGVHRLYEHRFLGSGPEEFRRLLSSAVHLGAVVAVLAYATKTEVARGFLGLALPTALVLGLAARYALRLRLHRARRAGRGMQRVVAAGHAADVVRLVDQLALEPSHGLQVVGACLPQSGQVDVLLSRGIPAVGGFDNVLRTVRLCGADTVAVVSSPELAGEELRRLSWKLESSGTSLIVAPGLVEVAGPRLSIRPAAGLSLLHVEHPRLSGGRRIAKSALDRGLAAAALLLLSPLLLAVAVVVALTSPGPAVYRQRRVGVGGREFTMYKFRTMYRDADARRAALLARNEGNDVLFKMRNDPRVTRAGRFLRRYSLDELPQLLNVLLGHMALVGPRPPLPEEVAQYPEEAHRRLLVRPGLTGLWQVSGRSDLSWEESLRLDLRYVDNWSLALDVLILWKTGRAVVRGSGAY
ncbi:sugar transferase [Vallicoccus soli]|uniref:Sugar transferase n=1 Tax=Vallicoccus soli TaxID=2339232 RepID=A0A3A3Z4G9_9ACTN|nr:sugar transferase [Vallicoccus soli]RJK97863.1 sugar transferase [Vallicoccus soli]